MAKDKETPAMPGPSNDAVMQILMKMIELGETISEIDKQGTRLDEKVIHITEGMGRGRERFDKIEGSAEKLKEKVTKMWVIYGLVIVGMTVGVSMLVHKFFEMAGQLQGVTP